MNDRSGDRRTGIPAAPTDLEDEAVDALARQFGEEILLDYATGSLDEATRLMVAAQMALHPDVRDTVSVMGDVAGLMLDKAEPMALGEGAFDRVMAAIEALPEATGDAAGADDDIAKLPEVIRERMVRHGGKWSFVTPGVRAMDLGFDAGEGEVRLYRIEPGYGVPTHSHKGGEMTLVLTGAFGDGRDRYAPGDICVASQDVTHKPIAEKGETCFALAITDAPLQLTGALGLVQRVLGS